MFDVNTSELPNIGVELQSRSYGELLKEGNQVRIKYTTGYAEVFDNKYEPEELLYDEENLFSWVEAVKDENIGDIIRTAEIINNEGLVTKPMTVRREDLSKAETNQEYCLFKQDGLGVFAKGKKIILLNPTVGTFSRYLNTTDSGHFETHTTATGLMWDRLLSVAAGKEYKGLKRFKEIDPEAFYYLSFGSKFVGHKEIKHFLAWNPNPVSLANLGAMLKVQEGQHGYKISYTRSGLIKTYFYPKYPKHFIYSVDFIYERYHGVKAMRRSMPFAYDLYSSAPLFEGCQLRFYDSLLYPVGARFLVGKYWADDKSIFDQKKRIHKLRNYRKRLNGKWRRPDSDGHVARIACFMTSLFSARVIHLGPTFAVKRVKAPTDIKYKGAYYKRIRYDYKEKTLVLRKRNNKWLEVPLRPLNFNLQDMLGSEHYSNCTYQTVYGTRYEYIDDENFNF